MIDKVNIDDIINETIRGMGLPSDTKGIGFVVHLESTDEFLMDSKDVGYADNRLWAKTPSLAKIYSQKKAIKEAKKYGASANVTYLLDAGDRYINIISLRQEDLIHYDKNGRLRK